MAREQVLEKLERVAHIGERFSGLADKIPRLIGMAGTAFFAGKASERVGGTFEMGAIGGAVAHDLAHSQLPNNQLGGIALAAYLSAIGLLNILPMGPPTVLDIDPDANIIGAGGTVLDPKNVYGGLAPNEATMSIVDCYAAGGTVVRVIPQSALCVCALPPPPPPPPHEAPGVPLPPFRPGKIIRTIPIPKTSAKSIPIPRAKPAPRIPSAKSSTDRGVSF